MTSKRAWYEPWIERVSGRRGGRPTIKDSRIEPCLVWLMHKHGASCGSILKEYPSLSMMGICAGIAWVSARGGHKGGDCGY